MNSDLNDADKLAIAKLHIRRLLYQNGVLQSEIDELRHELKEKPDNWFFKYKKNVRVKMVREKNRILERLALANRRLKELNEKQY